MALIRQPNSRHCYVCGLENPIGLKVRFYQDDETGKVVVDYTPDPHHEGWPGHLHGGVILAIFDEVLGRAGFLKGIWTMTGKLEVRFRAPVPMGVPLRFEAWIEEERRRFLVVAGHLLLPDGTKAVTARGTYVRVPEEQLEAFVERLGGDWEVYD